MRVHHLVALLSPVAARLLHSIPEDTHAFPKFRVSFLNSLPLAKDIAHHWQTHGLDGGLLEFLDQPSGDGPPREIEGAISISSSDPAQASNLNFTLEYMKMGPKDSYLCLVPSASDRALSAENEDLPEIGITPARSWSLLQPLNGTCLYHRQGWFTYSYCHNNQIRQFKEAAQAPSPTGGHRMPEEDPEWEAYTLGKAPQPSADLALAERNAQTANVELAQGPSSRYLVQKWGDGTLCDKTGRSREVEVQFHCSMTMTDSILFVRETKTCSYVVVINTPRLCGEPGFKSPGDKGEEGEIRCREIVDVPPNSMPGAPSHVPDADYPIKLLKNRPVLPPPVVDSKSDKETSDGSDLFRKTIESFVKNSNMMLEDVGAGDDIIFELVDASDLPQETIDRLTDILQGAGLDVTAEKIVLGGDTEKEQTKKKQKKKLSFREEL